MYFTCDFVDKTYIISVPKFEAASSADLNLKSCEIRLRKQTNPKHVRHSEFKIN